MNENLEKIRKYLLDNGVGEEEIEEYFTHSVYLSMAIMKYAHRDQTRENGEEYANHPSRVMQSYRKLVGITPDDYFCIDEDLMIKHGIPYRGVQEVALLHDVIEDTEFTLNDVREIFVECGFEDFFDMYIKVPLDNVTHIKSMDYLEYIKICLKHPISAMVKMLDLQDNLHVLDLITFDKSNYERSQRYLSYIYLINSYYHFIENNQEYLKEFVAQK